MIYQNKKKILYEKVFTHKKNKMRYWLISQMLKLAAQISPVVDEVPTEVPTEGSVVTFSLNCLNQEKWHTFIIYK
jgi:hypothetical protein